MKKLNEGLSYLLDKYMIEADAKIIDENTVSVNGKEIPVFPHRFERRFSELKNIVTGGTLCGISVMRTMVIEKKSADIYSVLRKEADICRYVLQRDINSVMVFENGNVLNAVLEADDGVICTIELALTLGENGEPKDKHEIISERGIACDIVVDAQLKQDSVYLFGENEGKFTDTDFELYGLNAHEASVVRAAFNAAKSDNSEWSNENAERLDKIVSLAKKSAQSGEKEVISL